MKKSVIENQKRQMRIVKFSLAVLFFAASFTAPYYGYTYDKYNPQSEADADRINREIALSIECHSGTPPILEFVLKDPGRYVNRVDFDFDMDSISDLTITIHEKRREVIFRGTPYRIPGTYRFKALLYTNAGIFDRNYEISFVRFVWGKNNFSFANDGEFEDKIDFVSTTILDWGKNRFGPLDLNQKVLLLYIMYSLYKGSIGRCYGFSGGELLYLEHPDLLPWPYNCAYEIPEEDPRIIRAMDFKQNDIVFENFITGKISIRGEQSNEDLKKQLNFIEGEIKSARPVVLGYVSRKMHHSMVVYGYWKNFFRNKTTLLLANNWERNQCNNFYSEDAENIVVTFEEDYHKIVWHELTADRYRYPDIIFGIEPRCNYSIKRRQFEKLLEKYRSRILKEKINVIIVEKTETAYLTDGKIKSGYSKPRYFYNLKDVSFKKIDYNFVFEYPSKDEYSLVLKKRRYNGYKKMYKKVNIFVLSPMNDGSIKAGIHWDVKIYDDKNSIFKLNNGVLERVE